MSFWSAVVFIVAIIAVMEMVKSRHRLRSQDGGTDHRPAPPLLDPDARREIEDLRERIKVLERIATDNNTLSATETRRIAQEIDALRDRADG